MPKQILKRDGRLETWSTDRIAEAILKALKASGIKDPLLAKRLAGKVEHKLSDHAIPEQELVQDTVEQVLMESRLFAVAKRYIIYRETRRTLRDQKAAFLKGQATEIEVPRSGRKVPYDPQKRIGVAISRLGAARAVALGAYAYALDQLDRRA